MAETLQERQSNELEALKAIFNDQIVDNNTYEATNIWKPLDVIITVLPEGFTNAQQNNILIDLHIKASVNYPNEIPCIKLQNAKGIPSYYLVHLEKQLSELASKIIGEVMVFEFVQHVQSFLSLYNTPQYSSFYEEMMSKKHKKHLEELESRKQEIELTKQLIHNELNKKKEALKQEFKMYKNKTKGTLNDKLNEYTDYNTREISDSVNTNSPLRRNLQQEDQIDESKWTHDFVTDHSFSNSNSRLHKEFIILSWLGKGAFGDVLKVKNKLDDCLYAIKCIQLSKKNKILNKKITREVKLLSRLNHENVVRYFNSWIETAKVSEEGTPQKNGKSKTNELCPLKNISCSWKLSDLNEEINSDDSSEEENWISFIHQSNSENATSSSAENTTCHTSNQLSINNDNCLNDEIDQSMYIQMEFCEKSTLRIAIDNDLYKEPMRVWRLLREIVEGLSYIHQQGIIHRDLKPVNIFIDSDDHVKIGDFGLATTVIQRHIPDVDLKHNQDIFINKSQTGNIGTALYVAPEINILGPKAIYNEKVDIYSLGIIFFEMCHKPFSTEMERIKVLSDLRMYECILPTEYLKIAEPAQKYITKWLLNHDPSKRPNSTDILQSQYIPPPKLKDTELHEMVRNTLSNSNSKNYKHLIASCFSQNVNTVEDITFTMTTGKNVLQHGRLQNIIDIVREVFELHGGVWLCIPLLIPAMNSMINETTVTMMARWGGLTCLPHSLRIPFARFLAHNPTISNLKRYSIDRVYRERRVYGVHPRELYEAAFDIISSSQDVIAEAELLSIAVDIFIKLKDFNQKNCIIRLNHISLVQGILMYSGIEKARHLEICRYFAKFKQKDLTQEQIEELEGMGFANHQINIAMNYFSMEHSLADMYEVCRKITIRKSKCGIFSREGLRHIEAVIKHIESLNVKFSVVIAPGLMNITQFYTGLIFEIVYYKNSKKSLAEFDVLAAGGRYDKLISSFKKNLDMTNDIKQTASGISFSLDKLAVMFHTQPSGIDVVLSSSNNLLTEEKLNIAKDLWNLGIKTLVLNVDQTLEQIQDYCQELYVNNIVMLKESKSVILRHLMGDKFQDKVMSVTEFIEYMRHKNRKNSNSVTSPTKTVRNDVRSTSENQHINIVFFTEEKLTTNVKRRYESQILNGVSKLLQKFSSKTYIEILALNIEIELLKALSLMDLTTIDSDIAILIKRFSHYKKDLNKVYNYIIDTKLKNTDNIFVFYTLKGNMFKLMIG
ncbi:Protein kinase, ATP binding site,Serine/threonine-protein kinase, active site,Protein [Cinara cedri]|uniref:non-specific serine/threonine protein kinase n=1 Tax=Cinara cedri TaxID=506608 RepID=A0A5E4N0Z4_9HEMI|nr:Protein kinase, ATP binding site,Serine/threonine-protein kinase, active site,Protein [Cinara cedri]